MTCAPKLTRADGRIDWTRDASLLDRQIRGLNPWPGTETALEGEALKVLAAAPVAASGAPGTVLDSEFTVACGAGALRLLTVQRPGRKALGAAAFCAATPFLPAPALADRLWALLLEYDGGPFVGWQRQANGLSVQEVLETAAARLNEGQPCPSVVAGRTDAGVHAAGQVTQLALPTSSTRGACGRR